ncbi:Gfo/Idh/MocA family oxidoreductase [Paenibacillus melissococcoides]|uniref:Gfo/Idh/MocA family oxidoreductase n=1 Tax=Paenibacillus melissococcoides TaxID=2912268 RepID=A0ABN8U3D0_9BACL|nr:MULTISPECIES: Gfo/Idh/MocA family oxidoreductase [Paenibacillus]MEB9897664.1 Gfo/Idh/MocA family oxidoreductase [Bacillus cereus]CAH8245577.1 Gfo/Idh/MocA family oxidoreductase [Paenibacillus melissococcoides]CAH8711360.1 Gfo/Idh/MocA family oxidoreductase [Paenibacillus melissococcoides]CAH8712125.1 Gfo/Idh/MocA family oxidoreductase [Paenibacillus melissococcoides]GIO76913.1 oxidoreductase [Paenibacillus dendritiformis]
MDTVRIGVIGLGNMGSAHAKCIARGEITGAVLGAVCDSVPGRREWAKSELGERIPFYSTEEEMLASGEIDAVLIATPHYHHPQSAINAFEHGLHVLIEKPAGVYTKQVREMNERAARSGKVFGIMYNQRSQPIYQKLRDLIQSGELGEIRRTNWIITNWYRPQSYYNSGGWRATWAGEGGGVLINQDPHQLDLWQWTTGLVPKRVRSFCRFGHYRDIEVEDDVTAYVEYENGATGVFVTTTGEAPGTNRFEITGDRGKVVIEHGKLTFWRLRVAEPEFNREYEGMFGQPECWKCEIPVHGQGGEHRYIIQNWTDAIRTGAPLLAPGEEGIHGLTLSNAMLLSTWTDNWVTFPLDEELFHAELQKRIAQSRYSPDAPEEARAPADMSRSFGS